MLRFSLPAGLIAAIGTFAAYEVLRRDDGVDLIEARTGAALVLLGIGLVVLTLLARPVTPRDVILVAAMAGSYLLALAIPWLRDYFVLTPPSASSWVVIGVCLAVSAALIAAMPRLAPWLIDEPQET